MRAGIVAVVGLVVLVSGCTSSPDPCGELALTTSVVEVRGTDVVVDGGSLVLHASGADIYLRDGPICGPATLGDVRVGDALGHDATEIAESYPMQAWPTTILVSRSG